MKRASFVLASALALVACHEAGDGPSTDPARVAEVAHLGDGRPLARITAMRALAPEADRFEVHEIANKAKSGNEEVRVEAARALGVAKPRDTIDLLGAMLADPLDDVRAAAVDALAGKHDPKADAYVSHVYETGGPLTRAAVARAGADVFERALAEEALDRRKRVDRALHFDRAAALKESLKVRQPLEPTHPDLQLESAMLEELGRGGGPAAVKELVAKLAAPEALVAAGAAAGLADAGAKDELPALEKALQTRDPILAPAAARALGELDAKAATGPLVDALAGAADPLTNAVLDVLGAAPLSPELAAKVCDAAKKESDATLAMALFHEAGAACAPDPTLPDDPKALAQKLLVLAALGPKTPELLDRARSLVASDDAFVAAGAATYLGVFGGADDANLVAGAGSTELAGIDRARAALEEQHKEAVETAHVADAQQIEQLDALAKLSGQKPPSQDTTPLQKLAERATPRSLVAPLNPRPGSVELVVASFAAAAKLGAEALPLVTSLVAEDDARLRLAAVDVADLAPKGDAARAMLRQSKDAEVATAMALRDVDDKRPGALAHLVELAPAAPSDEREAMVRALSGDAPAAKKALLAYAADDDVSALPALRALANVTGPDVDSLLAARALSSEAGVALAAVDALSSRAGVPAEAALAAAATHPDGGVREAALSALAKRPACAVATLLSPLAGDFEQRVRQAASALARACPRPAVAATHE